MENKYTWHKIADAPEELDFAPNNITEINAGEKKICLARHNNELFAIAHKCPHASGPMSQGYIDPLGNIVCPLHRYKFSLKNGRNVSGEGYFLKNWPVEIRDDGVYVGLDKEKLFGLF